MKTIFTFLALSILIPIYSQQKAITESGDEIFVYEDGTWKYVEEESGEFFIPTNENEFSKIEIADFLLKSKNNKSAIWVNPKQWEFGKPKNNVEAEYEFKLKNGDLYGMLLCEEIEIPLSSLKQVAIENAKTAAPDIKVVEEEYRIVNGNKVLMLVMKGTMNGIKFAYFGYYFANENGSTQFITYTSQALLNKYKNDSEDLLNGLVQIEE